MSDTPPSRHLIGTLLVSAQFALILGLGMLAAKAVAKGLAPLGAWWVAVAGVMVGLWSLVHNRPGNFNIRPAPRDDGQLVQTGPYRWIRHPMYTAVIAVGLACAWTGASVLGWAALSLLVVVLAVKANFEERWLRKAHPGYAAYCQQTRRFLPGIY